MPLRTCWFALFAISLTAPAAFASGFKLKAVLPADTGVRSVALADLNHDGKLDLVVASYLRPGICTKVFTSAVSPEWHRASGTRPSSWESWNVADASVLEIILTAPRTPCNPLFASMSKSGVPCTPMRWEDTKDSQPITSTASIDHAVKYVDGRVHTNGLENFWSLLKRGIAGTYISVEPFHLFRYLDEQVFRYNNRATKYNPLTDSDRFDAVILNVIGKRVTFAQLTGKLGETCAFQSIPFKARQAA